MRAKRYARSRSWAVAPASDFTAMCFVSCNATAVVRVRTTSPRGCRTRHIVPNRIEIGSRRLVVEKILRPQRLVKVGL